MTEKIFSGIFDSQTTQVIDVQSFLLCMFVSLLIGAFLAFAYTYKSRYTQSFVITLAVIPAVVCMIIMLVNGNVGAGVAVAGTFSLVRFRSVPGTAKEIGAIFLAMGTGLASGMGYLGYAVLFSVILGGISLLYWHLGFGDSSKMRLKKTLHITIPENLDYTNIFDDLLKEYTTSHKMLSVKTTNMGSLFRLTYDIELKSLKQEKTLIDELRCRNGNLEISITEQEVSAYEL